MKQGFVKVASATPQHGSLNSLPTLVPTLFPAVIYYYKPFNCILKGL